MHFFSILHVCVRATASVFFLMTAGALVVSQLSDNGKQSVKGLSTAQVFVLLPSLIVSRMATGFSWDLLYQGRYAMAMSLTQIFTGVMSSKIAAALGISPPGYESLVFLVTSSQNAIVYPFALFQGVRGVPWLNGLHQTASPTEDFFERGQNIAQMYLLVYNVIFSLNLWSFGHSYVKQESEKINRATAREEVEVATASEEQETKDEGNAKRKDDNSSVTVLNSLKRFFEINVRPMISPPIVASMAGIPLGLIPITRWMAQEGPITAQIIHALWVLGDAAIPLSLVIVGCSLRQTLANTQEKKSGNSSAEQSKVREGNPVKGILAPIRKEKKIERAVTDSYCSLEQSSCKIVLNTAIEAPLTLHTTRPPLKSPFTPFPVDVPLTKSSVLRWASTPVARALQFSSIPQTSSVLGSSVTVPQPCSRVEKTELDAPAVRSSLSFGQLLKLKLWDDFDARFIIVVCCIRFIVMPIVMALTAVVIGLRPENPPLLPSAGDSTNVTSTSTITYSEPGTVVDRPRILALVCMLESFTPCAMNAMLICAMYSFKTQQMSFMLLIHYIVSLGTSSLWLSYALWYLEP